jgi:hypothetical protein
VFDLGNPLRSDRRLGGKGRDARFDSAGPLCRRAGAPQGAPKMATRMPAGKDLRGNHLRNYHNGKRIRTPALIIKTPEGTSRPASSSQNAEQAPPAQPVERPNDRVCCGGVRLCGLIKSTEGLACSGERVMGVLLFKCPKTGKSFSTGIQA